MLHHRVILLQKGNSDTVFAENLIYLWKCRQKLHINIKTTSNQNIKHGFRSEQNIAFNKFADEYVNVVIGMNHFVTVWNLISYPSTIVTKYQNQYCEYAIKCTKYSSRIILKTILTFFPIKFQLLLHCYVTEYTLLHNWTISKDVKAFQTFT